MNAAIKLKWINFFLIGLFILMATSSEVMAKPLPYFYQSEPGGEFVPVKAGLSNVAQKKSCFTKIWAMGCVITAGCWMISDSLEVSLAATAIGAVLAYPTLYFSGRPDFLRARGQKMGRRAVALTSGQYKTLSAIAEGKPINNGEGDFVRPFSVVITQNTKSRESGAIITVQTDDNLDQGLEIDQVEVGNPEQIRRPQP